jgi:hypothetical protein
VAGNPVTGGFDPHSLPPFVLNYLRKPAAGIYLRPVPAIRKTVIKV